MHSDPAEVQRAVRTYLKVGAALFVFTVITVGVNRLHVESVALAIGIALIIAAFKGSMVASIFMHLSHEKQWIYGSLLLTVVFFIFLIFVPLATVKDTIGSPNPGQTQVMGAEHAGH